MEWRGGDFPMWGSKISKPEGCGEAGGRRGEWGRWRPLFQLHPRIPWKDHQAAWFVTALGSALWLVPQSGQMFRLQQGAWKIPTLHTHPTGSHIHTCLRTIANLHTPLESLRLTNTISHSSYICKGLCTVCQSLFQNKFKLKGFILELLPADCKLSTYQINTNISFIILLLLLLFYYARRKRQQKGMTEMKQRNYSTL